MKKLIILFLLAAAGSTVYAQTQTYSPVYPRPMAKKYFGFTYNMAWPVGTTRDFIDKTSFSGFSLEGRSASGGSGLMLGGYFGWNLFYQVKSDPITIEQEGFGGTVSGTQERYVNSMPILFTAAYDLGGDMTDMVQPFVSMGIGMTYYVQTWGLGVALYEQRTWHFTLMPEVGTYVYLDDRGKTSLYLAGRYLLAFDSGEDVIGRDDNQLTYFMLGVGLQFSPF